MGPAPTRLPRIALPPDTGDPLRSQRAPARQTIVECCRAGSPHEQLQRSLRGVFPGVAGTPAIPFIDVDYGLGEAGVPELVGASTGRKICVGSALSSVGR